MLPSTKLALLGIKIAFWSAFDFISQLVQNSGERERGTSHWAPLEAQLFFMQGQKPSERKKWNRWIKIAQRDMGELKAHGFGPWTSVCNIRVGCLDVAVWETHISHIRLAAAWVCKWRFTIEIWWMDLSLVVCHLKFSPWQIAKAGWWLSSQTSGCLDRVSVMDIRPKTSTLQALPALRTFIRGSGARDQTRCWLGRWPSQGIVYYLTQKYMQTFSYAFLKIVQLRQRSIIGKSIFPHMGLLGISAIFKMQAHQSLHDLQSISENQAQTLALRLRIQCWASCPKFYSAFRAREENMARPILDFCAFSTSSGVGKHSKSKVAYK